MRAIFRFLCLGMLIAFVSSCSGSGNAVPAVRDYTSGNPARNVRPQSVIGRCPPYDPNCVGGGGGGGGTLPCNFVSKTEATVPSNQARTTIGVGEKVDLSTTDGGPFSITSNSDNSTLASDTLTAGDLAGTVTVAVGAGSNCKSISKTFTVVAPTAGYYDRSTATVAHDQGLADIGKYADVYLGPATVSFTGLSYRETNGTVSVNGTWYCNTSHIAAPALTVGATYDSTKGWLVGRDTNSEGACYSTKDDPHQFLQSTATVTIPTQYSVGGGLYHTINTVTMSATDNTSGQLTISKDQMQGSTAVDSPDNGWGS